MAFGIHSARNDVVKQITAVLAAENHSNPSLYFTPRPESQAEISRISESYLRSKVMRHRGADLASQLGILQQRANALAVASPVSASKNIFDTCERFKSTLNNPSPLSAILPPPVTHSNAVVTSSPIVPRNPPPMPADVTGSRPAGIMVAGNMSPLPG